jgi:hypothetical protein
LSIKENKKKQRKVARAEAAEASCSLNIASTIDLKETAIRMESKGSKRIPLRKMYQILLGICSVLPHPYNKVITCVFIQL